MRLLRQSATRQTATGGAFALAALLSLVSLTAIRPTHAAGATGNVAYIGDDGGVYSVSVAGGSPTELWTPSGQSPASEPQWAPNGSAVAFIGGDGNVWTVSAGGGNAHALTQQASPPSGCNDEICQNQGARADTPRWSPDSRTISYRLIDNAAKASIWSVSAAGGTPTQLTSADGLCLFNEGFTPSGIPLFSRCAQTDGATNATYESASGGASQLLSGSQIAYAPAGNRLAYAQQTQAGGSVDVALYMAAADGSGATLVAQGGQDPAWSSNGLLAYQVNTPNGRQIHVYDPASGKDTAVAYGMLAGWSADGGWLVYTTTDDSGNTQIMRAQPDGSGATLVAHGDFPSVSAA